VPRRVPIGSSSYSFRNRRVISDFIIAGKRQQSPPGFFLFHLPDHLFQKSLGFRTLHQRVPFGLFCLIRMDKLDEEFGQFVLCFSGSFTTSAITCSINFDIGMKKSPSA
jgi:hypothetical protein